ncbi:hypothetical protein [Rhodococcus sp. NPDC058521]|uniref:hypothetical protein n=1 Tax=Rhodococcus sp. NPDC058521 TaxID=3346536 RepID=UPI0036518451
MARRIYKRDAAGRFAKTHGRSIAGAAIGGAVGGALGSKTARKRLVAGSVQAESHIGTTKNGKWTGAKIGARYKAPAGREVVVKGIVGVSKPKPAPKPKAPTAPKGATPPAAKKKASAGSKASATKKPRDGANGRKLRR